MDWKGWPRESTNRWRRSPIRNAIYPVISFRKWRQFREQSAVIVPPDSECQSSRCEFTDQLNTERPKWARALSRSIRQRAFPVDERRAG